MGVRLLDILKMLLSTEKVFYERRINADPLRRGTEST